MVDFTCTFYSRHAWPEIHTVENWLYGADLNRSRCIFPENIRFPALQATRIRQRLWPASFFSLGLPLSLCKCWDGSQAQSLHCVFSYSRLVLNLSTTPTLVAELLARSQYPEGPATGHLGTGFSWFPCV